ncbi:hypothetical protein NE237_011336 [Protea cynaroides]|uniref:Uncharacterized protein n=1 Tax=Protea cynaroides TaxID=273540 RepID=A0A9Q0GVH0_9MAGN|nr:hypothetical protein NE237_011336 [Protea cynaroides]
MPLSAVSGGGASMGLDCQIEGGSNLEGNPLVDLGRFIGFSYRDPNPRIAILEPNNGRFSDAVAITSVVIAAATASVNAMDRASVGHRPAQKSSRWSHREKGKGVAVEIPPTVGVSTARDVHALDTRPGVQSPSNGVDRDAAVPQSGVCSFASVTVGVPDLSALPDVTVGNRPSIRALNDLQSQR